jgi:hypothetical protein
VLIARLSVCKRALSAAAHTAVLIGAIFMMKTVQG